jgi:kynureninase
MRPVLTGWFAEFASRGDRSAGPVDYGSGADAFAGATYDPTSHYRAAAVFRFHAQQELTADRLRNINRRQVARLKSGVEALGTDERGLRVEAMPEERRAGFLAVRTRRAADIVLALRTRGVFSDARGDILRIGPAPYLDDQQLDDGVAALAETLKDL